MNVSALVQALWYIAASDHIVSDQDSRFDLLGIHSQYMLQKRHRSVFIYVEGVLADGCSDSKPTVCCDSNTLEHCRHPVQILSTHPGTPGHIAVTA
jgi:hypothetical protein